ncbi:MAG TPA: glycosyltransferase family 39 protein [Candidatus Binataceae bacterium]
MRRAAAIVRGVPREAWAVGAITIVGAILRMLFLGKQSLWNDEGYSAYVALLPWHSLVEVMEPNMGLYYIMLHFWAWFGDSEFMLRLPSVICSVATIPVLYSLGKRLFDWRLGIIAALLMAVHAFDIQYAQEARSYSLVVLLITISSVYLLKGLERPTLANWILYILASILALYAHLFAGLILVAQWVFLLFSMYRTWSWRQLGVIGLALVILSVPAVLLVFRAHSGRPQWIPQTSFRGVILLFDNLAGSEPISPNIAGHCLAVLYLIGLLAGVVAFASAWFNRSRDAMAGYGFLLSGVLVPLILALAVSIIKPLIIARYFLVCLPFLILLTAAVITELRPRLLLLGMLVVFLSLESSQSYEYYVHSSKEDWRDAVLYLLANAQPGDAAIVVSGQRVYRYYRDRLDGKQAYPVGLSLRYLSGSPKPETGVAAQSRHTLDPEWLETVRCDYLRVWLIFRAPITLREAREESRVSAALKPLYDRRKSIRQPYFAGVRVMLFSSSMPTLCPDE